jgi:hypothetical protein
VSEAERWLRGRLADGPPALLEAMADALSSDSSDAEPSVADALAAASVRLYQRVLAGTGGREDALPLLAADALLTHAMEAQAEADPDGLADFAERWGGAGALGRLAEPAAG